MARRLERLLLLMYQFIKNKTKYETMAVYIFQLLQEVSFHVRNVLPFAYKY